MLDRKAERRSRLLDELVNEGSSINDVTRSDLLVAIPGVEGDWRPGLDEWILDPHKRWEDGVGAPGLVMSGVDRETWASRLWELLSDQVEQCQSEKDQERISQAIDQSASSICDYLGLNEEDIPSLLIFSLTDRKVFVFRHGGDADNSPYQFLKYIAIRRPLVSQPDWLTRAVLDVASNAGLVEGPVPELAPPSLDGWVATRYLPRDVDTLAWERGRS